MYGNAWEMYGIQISSLIFQFEDFIIFKFDVQHGCTARKALSCAIEYFPIQWEGIEKNWKYNYLLYKINLNVLKMYVKIFSIALFQNDATIGCKFDLHQCGRAQ